MTATRMDVTNVAMLPNVESQSRAGFCDNDLVFRSLVFLRN
jgi:hypothetical protein